MLNKRTIKKWLSTLVLLGWGVVWQPLGFAGRSISEFSDSPAYRSGAEALAQPHGFILADNHRAEEETNKTNTSHSGKVEKNVAGNNEKKTEKENMKTKSLKPFEPTEKVKADQAVDFPYDI